jgi:hypothetical protein
VRWREARKNELAASLRAVSVRAVRMVRRRVGCDIVGEAYRVRNQYRAGVVYDRV